MTNPHVIKKCGHTYDYHGLVQLLDHNNNLCPSCRVLFTRTDIIPNQVMQRVVDNIIPIIKSFELIVGDLTEDNIFSREIKELKQKIQTATDSCTIQEIQYKQEINLLEQKIQIIQLEQKQSVTTLRQLKRRNKYNLFRGIINILLSIF